MYRRIVFAAVQGSSFDEASESLAELAEVQLLSKRVWRAAKRIGEERVAETQQAVAEFEQLPLPARQQSPIEPTLGVVCVQMDGGAAENTSGMRSRITRWAVRLPTSLSRRPEAMAIGTSTRQEF